MTADDFDSLWGHGLSELNCDISDKQLSQLKQYLQLLQRWNKAYNLTAIRDPQQMIPLHIFDSLSVAPFIRGDYCLDVGSGGGLPGIPLAITQPERHFTLLDTNGKKTRFMQQAAIELKLHNITVIHSRVEKHQPEQLFDSIISRAFASIIDFINSSALHLTNGGEMLAMKGQYPKQEIGRLPVEFVINYSEALKVPNLSAERYLISIKKF